MRSYVRIPIIEAAGLCGVRLKSSTLDDIEVQGQCPFCDDNHHHLYLNTEDDVFFCQRCGAGGNSVTLYARLNNVDNRTAYQQLKASVKGTLPPRKALADKPPAPLAVRHDVYYDLLGMLPLFPMHRKKLLERGLSQERIAENLYRSMPGSYGERRRITAELEKVYDLNGVPGFYLRDGQWTFAGSGGYLIPIYTKDGYIQGMQVRQDHASGKDKYRWFSSNPAKNFACGTKAQSWVHVTGDPASPVACVTEGGLKGDVASYYSGNALFVCVPGVNNLRFLSETLAGLKLVKVVGAYDMDKLENKQVRDSLEKVERIVRGMGLAFEPYQWSPIFKGIDDFLYARHLFLNGRANLIGVSI